MLGSVQHRRRIRYPEKELQCAVVDGVGAYGSQTRERGRFTKTRQMSAGYPNTNQRQRRRRFDTEEDGTCKSLPQAFSCPKKPREAMGYRYIEVDERQRHRERANQQ